MDGAFHQRTDLARFDRQTDGRDLPLNIGRATEEFNESLDRHLARLMEAAQTRASEVEREADRYASRKRNESQAGAQQMLEAAFARASRALDSIELIESALSGMLDTLRAEFEELAPGSPREAVARAPASIELDSHASLPRAVPAGSEPPPPASPSRPEPLASPPSKPSASKDQPPQSEDPPLRSEDPQPVRAEAQRPRIQVAVNPEPTDELDQLIRDQVKEMVSSGRPRAEVERFVGRFPLADNYVGMLDHLYRSPAHGPARRGFLGRFRRAR
jgi:hypothetical protein